MIKEVRGECSRQHSARAFIKKFPPGDAKLCRREGEYRKNAPPLMGVKKFASQNQELVN